jgi:predicted site-specific integrase-resolvase
MENTMRTVEAAKLLGITANSLQRCERDDRFVPAVRTTNARRRYVHCFSSRLYGLRNYRRQLRAALESDHAAGAPDQN